MHVDNFIIMIRQKSHRSQEDKQNERKKLYYLFTHMLIDAESKRERERETRARIQTAI